MRLKDVISIQCGLRYCFENLPLQSSYARSYMLESEMLIHPSEIDSVYDALRCYIPLTERRYNADRTMLQNKLSCLKNISGTIKRLENSSSLDDIELFEIKNLVLLSLDIDTILGKSGMTIAIPLPQLSCILTVLDPDDRKEDSFYVYDSYSEELNNLRKKIRLTADILERQSLMDKTFEIETTIRKRLGDALRPYTDVIKKVLDTLVNIDISLAKAIFMVKEGLSIPVISDDGVTTHNGMFNPEVRSVLQKRSKSFQNIDISISNKPTLIIGANMGGKTVVLKTLALCQYLFQFGFGIPSKSSKMALKEDICLVVGDSQSLEDGLSSFAAQMYEIDSIIKNSEQNNVSILALVDEPAHGTNPIEGTALVTALIKVLHRDNVTLAVTTHYNIDTSECIKLKVHGFDNGQMNYELSPSPHGDVPHEAMDVAGSLGISSKWLDEAKTILSNAK